MRLIWKSRHTYIEKLTLGPNRTQTGLVKEYSASGKCSRQRELYNLTSITVLILHCWSSCRRACTRNGLSRADHYISAPVWMDFRSEIFFPWHPGYKVNTNPCHVSKLLIHGSVHDQTFDPAKSGNVMISPKNFTVRSTQQRTIPEAENSWTRPVLR